MNNIQKYKLISEVVDLTPPAVHPNIDMLVQKPVLFYYASNENLEEIQNNGISDNGNGIEVFFARIPEIDKFSSFLSLHTPVKISVSKLARSSEPVKIVAIHFPKHENEEVSLTKESLKKIALKGDYFSRIFQQVSSADQIPRAKIYFNGGVIPSFTYKIIGSQEDEQR